MLARFGVAEYHVMVLNSKYLADHLNGQRERSLCGSTSRFRHAGKKTVILSSVQHATWYIGIYPRSSNHHPLYCCLFHYTYML